MPLLPKAHFHTNCPTCGVSDAQHPADGHVCEWPWCSDPGKTLVKRHVRKEGKVRCDRHVRAELAQAERFGYALVLQAAPKHEPSLYVW